MLEKCGFHREAVLKNWVTYPAQGGRPFDIMVLIVSATGLLASAPALGQSDAKPLAFEVASIKSNKSGGMIQPERKSS